MKRIFVGLLIVAVIGLLAFALWYGAVGLPASRVILTNVALTQLAP